MLVFSRLHVPLVIRLAILTDLNIDQSASETISLLKASAKTSSATLERANEPRGNWGRGGFPRLSPATYVVLIDCLRSLWLGRAIALVLRDSTEKLFHLLFTYSFIHLFIYTRLRSFVGCAYWVMGEKRQNDALIIITILIIIIIIMKIMKYK